MHNDHVTIDDVARRAGLSVATVSRVMHDSPRVSADARRRVQDAVAALGYSPNALARGLAMRRTSTVGVLVSSIADPFWAQVVRGIEDCAYHERYAVIIASSYEDVAREQGAVELFRHKRVDGIIVAASSGGPEALMEMRPRGVPVVFINNEHIEIDNEHIEPVSASLALDEPAGAGPVYLVANDDTQGAILVVEHLLALGHRRIGYIGATGRASSLRRYHGYRLTLERASVPRDDLLVVHLDEGADEGELGAFRLLAGEARPTALFCYDDVMALGALRAVRALGMQTPRDVSVVGFDDIPIAAYMDPPLTTVRQPMYEMGQQAMHMLLGLLRSEPPAPRVIMPGELVVRASSGPLLR